MKKVIVLAAAAAALAFAGQAAAADKKVLAIVVKGLDNAFFESIHQGCEKWNSENASSEYTCFYTGPASTSDEAGEAQIVSDLLAKPDTAAIAISPSNAQLMAQTLRTAKPTIPILAIDAPFAAADMELVKTYVGTDNKTMGVKLGEFVKANAASGGKICIIEGNPAAQNILDRATGFREGLTGQKDLQALTGQGGWTDAPGCPIFTNDDGAKGVQAMSDILAANPDIKAFAMMGGWPRFMAPQAYRDLFNPLKDKIASKDLLVVSTDTIGEEIPLLKEGLVQTLVGQVPKDMGYLAPGAMIKAIKGEKLDPNTYTGLDVCTKDNADTCVTK